jgi:predicted nucleic acid-binding protein
MAVYYLDTSALIKIYTQETGTAWIVNLTARSAGHNIYTVRVTGPEMIAALFRKARTGGISLADATRAAHGFRLDWQHQYWIIECDVVVTGRAMSLAEQHNLLGYDAVHLATALELHDKLLARHSPDLVFISADLGQLQIAVAEGLQVEDQNNH